MDQKDGTLLFGFSKWATTGASFPIGLTSTSSTNRLALEAKAPSRLLPVGNSCPPCSAHCEYESQKQESRRVSQHLLFRFSKITVPQARDVVHELSLRPSRAALVLLSSALQRPPILPRTRNLRLRSTAKQSRVSLQPICADS